MTTITRFDVLLLSLLLFWTATTSQAFTSPAVASFLCRHSYQKAQGRAVSLKAGGEAPQYDKIDAVLQHSEVLGKGNVLLHVQALPSMGKLDYQPGHVIALEMQDESEEMSKDTEKNGGWMRGPYTVSRATENTLDVVIRVVGKKSKDFANAPVNTPVRFGGRFKVPILEGIAKDEVQQVVLISTGVGVGPCIGAIEQALQDSSFPPITLLPSYREQEEVVYQEYLDKLSHEHSSKFRWQPIVTSTSGRLSSSPESMKVLKEKTLKGLSIADTHYHLIGNGQMVKEWQAGLEKAGVPTERVTLEQYFNHQSETDAAAIDNIASAVLSLCSVEA
jgi:NAD(P)H-flavin reductase